jgi:glyoxylase I family protein
MNHPAATPALPIRSLHHVARVTRRLQESRLFYRDVLGFHEIPRPELGFPGAWLFNYGLQIHLIVNQVAGKPAGAAAPGAVQTAAAETATIETRDNHLAFLVDDIEAAESRLASHGIAYRVNLQTATGLKQIFFRDPDGYHVEVATYR